MKIEDINIDEISIEELQKAIDDNNRLCTSFPSLTFARFSEILNDISLTPFVNK